MEPKKTYTAVSCTFDGPLVVWSFENTEGVVVGTRSIDTSKLSDEMKDDGLKWGIRHTGTDATALPADKKTGLPQSAEAKMAAWDRRMAPIIAGEGWTGERDLGGPLYAVMKVLKPGKFADAAAFKTWLEGAAKAAGMSPTNLRDQLLGDKKVKAELDKMRAERLKNAPKVDTGALIDGL